MDTRVTQQPAADPGRSAAIHPPVRVYWAPGCTSCLRVKEFLRSRGQPFESVNAATDAGAMDALRSLGARSVPVVERGGQWVYAQKLADVCALLGLDPHDDAPLPPAVLAERLDLVLAAALRYVAQIPATTLDAPFRNSWAPPRGLAHHVFRIVEAFLDAIDDGAELTNESIMKGTHAVRPGQDILGYGDAVRQRFARWWKAPEGRSFSTPMPTYWGDQPLHLVLERTTWHSAQHARQLMVVIESLGLAIDGPLTAADLAGLPLPASAWDAD
jgi:glutaredoxin